MDIWNNESKRAVTNRHGNGSAAAAGDHRKISHRAPDRPADRSFSEGRL